MGIRKWTFVAIFAMSFGTSSMASEKGRNVELNNENPYSLAAIDDGISIVLNLTDGPKTAE